MDLPFTQAQLRAAIPDRCFKPNTARSLAYPLFDAAMIELCVGALTQVEAWYFEAPADHHFEPGQGRETWKSAYLFAKNLGSGPQPAVVAAQ